MNQQFKVGDKVLVPDCRGRLTKAEIVKLKTIGGIPKAEVAIGRGDWEFIHWVKLQVIKPLNFCQEVKH